MLGDGFGKGADITGQNNIAGDEFEWNVVCAGINQLNETDILKQANFFRIDLLLRKASGNDDFDGVKQFNAFATGFIFEVVDPRRIL